MRIDCQSCGAAYAIDDNLIGDRGVRAQCPRCGAQKVVKKSDMAGAPAAPAGLPSDPFAQTAAPSNAFGPPPGGGAANPFGGAPSPFGAPGGSPFGSPGSSPGGAPPSPFGAPAGASPFGAPAGASPFGAPAGASPFGNPGSSSGGAPAASPFGPPAGGSNPFGAAPPNPFGAPAGAAPNPFGAPAGAAPNPFGAAGGASPFGAPPAPSGGNPFGAPAAGASPFGAPPAPGGGGTPFGGGGDPFGGPPKPAADPFGGPVRPAADPFGGPPKPAADPFGGPPSSGDPFGGPAPSGGGAPSLPAGSPFSFMPATGGGGPTSPAPAGLPSAPDPFSGGGSGDGGVPDPFADIGGSGGDQQAGGGKDAREWRVKLTNGTTLGPLTLDEVRQKVKAGEITKDAQAAQGNGNFRVITGFASLAVVFRAPSEGRGQKVVYRKQDSGLGKYVALLLAVGLLGAGGAVFHFRDSIFSNKDEVEYENIFIRRAQMWRLQFPDVDGTSEEHLIRGLKYFKQDTALGYRLADEEFHKSLVLDPDNLEAIGAYVENFGLIPARRTDVEATKDALDGIEFALKKNPRRGRLHRAYGALLLKMGRIEQAQGSLAQALRLDPQDAEAKLFMAQTNLDRNVAESIKLTEEAQRIDPELLRAPYILGLAFQKQGRFKTALNQFRSRLAKDKDHKETLLAISRLYVEVGDFEQAQSHLERLLQIDPKNAQARLQLARVQYQGLGDFRRAEQQFAEVVGNLQGDAAELAREVYTHQAFVLGERGKWKDAEEAIGNALRDDANYGPALYVAGRVLLHRQAAAEAKEKLEKAASLVSGTYLEAPVRTALGDVLRQQGQIADAVRSYTAVIKNDARYVRAYLAVASLYAENNNMQQAAAMMREVLDIDPFHRRDHFYFTDYPETPRDTEAYRDAWPKVKAGENDRSIVFSSEGITAFHAEQLGAAEELLKKALKDDRNNLAASMYLGAIDVAKKRGKDALGYLQQAQRTNTLHVRTMFLLGRAYQQLEKVEDAEKKFSEVHDSDPNFVGALNSLGELALRRGEDEKARDLFLEAFHSDADFTPAKANLLKCGY